jgi:hypothetical protein
MFLDEFWKIYGFIMDFKMTTLHLLHRKNEKYGLKTYVKVVVKIK